MIEIKQKVCEDIVDESQLDQLQNELGAVLPNSYRRFLREHNGGRPARSKFDFIGKQGERENSKIHYFFAAHKGKIGNLVAKYTLYRERIPQHHLPIACDPFGNLVLIQMCGGADSPVYFWDHEMELVGNDVRLISNSFLSFLQDLQ